MTATLEHQTDNIYLIRITGQLRKSDLIVRFFSQTDESNARAWLAE